MPPPSRDDVPSYLEEDVRAHARIISELTTKINEINSTIAVLAEANRHRDEKLNSILGLGRTVLITVLTLAIGAGFAFIVSGGLHVTAG